MKKYKNLSVQIDASDSTLIELLVRVKEYCNKEPFVCSDEVEKLYMPDDKMAHILSTLSGVPESVLLLYANDGKLDVINIVPYNKSTSHLTKEQYNMIIDAFDSKVITPLFKEQYFIQKSDDEVDIKNLIPKSYKALERWANCPGAPNHPFVHTSDLELWFEFLCQLRRTNEELSSGDLELWLQEDCNWPEDVIEDAIIRYETEVDLLEYYERHQ